MEVYTIQFTKEEALLVYEVFHVLMSENLEKWMELLDGKQADRGDLLKQWKKTGQYHDVYHKIGVMLKLREEPDLDKLMEVPCI